MQKYMEKVQKAQKLKQEKAEIEQKVFGTGRNWTPQITQPNAPNLTVSKRIEEKPEDTRSYSPINSKRPKTGGAIPALKKAYNPAKNETHS